MQAPDSPRSKPDLALVVIARNEARCIARCLLSAREVVHRMLVLDTGSTDDTIAIARSCGAQVHQMPWTDDFSAARNAALELADADWNLFLDADEWLESGADILRSSELHTPFLGFVTVRSDFEIDGSRSEHRCWIARLLPRGVRYEGRIHEQPVTKLPARRLPLVLGHDGYLPAQREKKADRNHQLLLQALEQEPGNAYLRYQLGTEHEVAGDFHAAANQYLQALASSGTGVSYRKQASARLIHCLARSEQFEQAIVTSSELMDECHDSPDFFFALGNLFLDLATQQPQEALQQWLPMAEASWLRCLEIGEVPEHDGVRGRGSFSAAHNLAVLYEGIQNAEKARHYAELATRMQGKQGTITT